MKRLIGSFVVCIGVAALAVASHRRREGAVHLGRAIYEGIYDPIWC